MRLRRGPATRLSELRHVQKLSARDASHRNGWILLWKNRISRWHRICDLHMEHLEPVFHLVTRSETHLASAWTMRKVESGWWRHALFEFFQKAKNKWNSLITIGFPSQPLHPLSGSVMFCELFELSVLSIRSLILEREGRGPWSWRKRAMRLYIPYMHTLHKIHVKYICMILCA